MAGGYGTRKVGLNLGDSTEAGLDLPLSVIIDDTILAGC